MREWGPRKSNSFCGEKEEWRNVKSLLTFVKRLRNVDPYRAPAKAIAFVGKGGAAVKTMDFGAAVIRV